MKKTITIIAASLSFALAAVAADNPKMETFLGYNFVRFNPDSGFVPSFNANGGSGQFVYNFWKGVGVASMRRRKQGRAQRARRRYHSSALRGWSALRLPQPLPLYALSPRLCSAAHMGQPVPGSADYRSPAATDRSHLPVAARLTASRTSFAMMIGGGLDIKFSKHMAFRPLAFDYYLTRVPSFIIGQ